MPHAARPGLSHTHWYRPLKPFGERLGQAIEYLEFRSRNLSGVAAHERLERFVAEQRKYLLFRKFFPLEWARSTTSLCKTGHYEFYTERTNEFFELVSENLFPLLEGWNTDPETDFEQFNVFSLNVDFCCDEIDYEYLRVSYTAALLFFSDDGELWEFLANSCGLVKDDLPEINLYPFENIWDLPRTGRGGLYLTIWAIIDHSTGNPWLDSRNCHPSEYFSWDAETVEHLAETYREAGALLEETELLDELIAENPREIIGEMISLWNDGLLPLADRPGQAD